MTELSDYLAVGHRLREQWLQRRPEMHQDLVAAVESTRHRMQHRPEYDFIRALYQHARGNSEYLIAYLRSDRPISALDRELLAQIIEGVLDRESRCGRPLNRNERAAAMAAQVFYRAWRTENETAGVKQHGHSNAMKDEAVRFIIKELEPASPRLNFETVRDLMDRPKSRRNT